MLEGIRGSRICQLLLLFPLGIVIDCLADWQHGLLALTLSERPGAKDAKTAPSLRSRRSKRRSHSDFCHAKFYYFGRSYLPPGAHADAAIVLGYALRRDGTPTPPLRERVEAAVRLFDKVSLDYIIFSGGHPGGGIRGQSEAAAMDKYAERISTRAHQGRWLLEDKSTSTRENAVFSLQMIEEHSWQNLVIVTNPFHQLRSWLVFSCATKELYSPARRPQIWLAKVGTQRSNPAQLLYMPLVKQWNFFREVLALGWYWYKGWLC